MASGLMSFVTSCIGPVFTVAGWVAPNLKHMWYFNENVMEFRRQWRQLECKKNDIQRSVERGLRNLEQVADEVNFFLTEYDEFKNECEHDPNILLGLDVASGGNMCSRYKLSKKAVKMKGRMNNLLDFNCSPPMVTTNLSPRVVENINTEYYEGLNSIEEFKKKVMDTIKDADASVIGLYGMGGIGKTTLMEQINNELENHPHSFKYVIMVTVSGSPDIRKLQGDIGRKVGLDFSDLTKSNINGRAEKLSKRLRKEESILIILDDVWEKLDLGAVGIPSGGGKNQCCKIVLTTRKKDVCNQMEAAPIIPMACLDSIESWNLFEWNAGRIVESESINAIAKDVCNECAGLPLAISVVATTLKNENKEYVWRDSLSYLKESNPIGLENLDKKVFNPLKLSYDRLGDDDLQSCFLICSLFPEDHAIQLSDLMYYGIGEGFISCREGSTSLDSCLTLLHKLETCGLLLHLCKWRLRIHPVVRDVTIHFAKMHDVVRDVAIHIAKEKGFFIKTGVGLTEWPLLEEEKCKGLKYISLMENSIQDISHRPQNGEGVIFLSLNNNKRLKSIHSDFWEGMQNLLMLDLRGTSMSELTPCIQKLKNLRVLMFRRSLLYKESRQISFMNIEDLIALRNLSVLCLQDTHIPELKEEFGELVHLRVIDFSKTKIDIIRPKVFSRLHKLEVLLMNWSFSRWKASNEEDGDLVAFVELASLKHLYRLNVDIDDEYIFSDEYTLVECFPSVEYFEIRSNSRETWNSDEDSFSNIVVLHDNIQLKNIAKWLKVLLKKTKGLYFIGISDDDISSLEQLNINGGTNLVDAVLEPDTVKVMHNLETLRIFNYPKYKKVIQYSSNTEGDEPILPDLWGMDLEALDGLHTIIVTPSLLPGGSFKGLTLVNIGVCHKLRFVFTWSMALCLVQLRTLTIRKCHELKHIIGKDGYDNFDCHSIAQMFPKLKWLILNSLPKLESVWQQQRQENMQMQWSFLEDLKVSKCRNLKRLFLGEQSAPTLKKFKCEKEWFQKLIWEDEQAESHFKSLIIPYEEGTTYSD